MQDEKDKRESSDAESRWNDHEWLAQNRKKADLRADAFWPFLKIFSSPPKMRLYRSDQYQDYNRCRLISYYSVYMTLVLHIHEAGYVYVRRRVRDGVEDGFFKFEEPYLEVKPGISHTFETFMALCERQMYVVNALGGLRFCRDIMGALKEIDWEVYMIEDIVVDFHF